MKALHVFYKTDEIHRPLRFILVIILNEQFTNFIDRNIVYAVLLACC